MMTYVVTTDRASLLDYCEVARVHPRAARLVQSPTDLEGADLGENQIVFYGDYGRLPKINEIVDVAKSQLLDDLSKTERRVRATH